MEQTLPDLTMNDLAVTTLTAKLDALTEQVAYLTEQTRIAERQRQERSELLHDLMPIANQAYGLTVQQLEEVKEYVALADWLRLGKRVLRNGPTLEKLLDQLDSANDLLDVVTPLSHDAYGKAVKVLGEMEQKGYFTFAKGGAQIADNIVSSFGEEDVKKLGENVVLILNTVKDMTQPEILGFVRSFVRNVELETAKPVDTSYGALISQMRDPNVRRGLALTMRVLRVIGAQAS